MAYDDLKEYGTEAAVKAAGKQRQQGKTCTSFLDLAAVGFWLTWQTRFKMEISVTGSVVSRRDETRRNVGSHCMQTLYTSTNTAPDGDRHDSNFYNIPLRSVSMFHARYP